MKTNKKPSKKKPKLKMEPEHLPVQVGTGRKPMGHKTRNQHKRVWF